MKLFYALFSLVFAIQIQAQTGIITGQLQNQDGEPVQYANIILYQAADSSMVKVETSDDTGKFKYHNISAGNYFLTASYVGLGDLKQADVTVTSGETTELGVLSFAPAAVDLQTATVTTTRSMVEVKPDRTVFNVQGTINSTGSDAVELLRKAPGVLVDNNENISVLGRSGVLVYVDGKRLPLSGDDLTAYLRNLPADQIDRFDIITNPGAKYEAEGNAGIIDIRLKKNENFGANGSVNTTGSHGRYGQFGIGANGNFRNKVLNTFASAGYSKGKRFNDMIFLSRQNGIYLDEINQNINENDNINYRVGTDFFIGKNQTIGFLVSGNHGNNNSDGYNKIKISPLSAPEAIDSVLIANMDSEAQRNQNSFNINYRFANKSGRSLNIDADYGIFTLESLQKQPNRYYDDKETTLMSEIIDEYETPSDIQIYTFKVDFEEEIAGGKLGIGSKLSRVASDNTYEFFNVIDGVKLLNNNQSNQFNYDENVYAGYLSFARPINKKWSFSAGLRTEITDATGDLIAYDPENAEPPVELNYVSWFPSAGLTWQVNRMNVLNFNYGRRINRPDYNVLNPFNNQLSELSFEKGNPRLRPEIVNNLEIGYTMAYRYNFKLAYSKTSDQITRLLAPDDEDPRAGFISWDNLASQTVLSANVSLPLQIKKWWNAYVNIGASHTDNQADYGDGAVVDVQAFNYSIYQQHTFTLPKGFNAEISGWYSGPGVWGGVFKFDPSYSLNLGLQRKFLNDQLNVKISANDIFYQSGWSGQSEFNGLISTGTGNWDSRRVSLNLSYNFGNQKVKSRKRKTGIEEESKRVGS